MTKKYNGAVNKNHSLKIFNLWHLTTCRRHNLKQIDDGGAHLTGKSKRKTTFFATLLLCQSNLSSYIVQYQTTLKDKIERTSS